MPRFAVRSLEFPMGVNPELATVVERARDGTGDLVGHVRQDGPERGNVRVVTAEERLRAIEWTAVADSECTCREFFYLCT
jgi:hypothetical protein